MYNPPLCQQSNTTASTRVNKKTPLSPPSAVAAHGEPTPRNDNGHGTTSNGVYWLRWKINAACEQKKGDDTTHWNMQAPSGHRSGLPMGLGSTHVAKGEYSALKALSLLVSMGEIELFTKIVYYLTRRRSFTRPSCRTLGSSGKSWCLSV